MPVFLKGLLCSFILLLLAAPALAQIPQFIQPAACQLGEDCWIVNYVDVNPAPGIAQDFRCGPLTYDDHHGTDFGLADKVAMELGTDVLAAAAGTVLRIRDEIRDKEPSAAEREKMLAENRGCGNGVFINHGQGWQSIYCHMKQDSITVRPGQKVAAGTKLGEIGQSGVAEFPHLHFGVFFEGRPADPFLGLPAEKDGANPCRAGKAPLWKKEANLQYQPLAIYAAGFKDGAPDFEAIKIDATGPDTLPASSPALTFWVALYGAAKDDRILIEILDPQGRIFARRDITQEKDRARQFYFIGRRTHKKGLVRGTYTGNVRIQRAQDRAAPLVKDIQRNLIVE